jgi:hypothetical protein
MNAADKMGTLRAFAKQLVEPARPRLKPSIIIVGAQKAGTSALFQMLAKHPRIIPPRVKELTFFGDDDAYAKGMAHYRSLLPLRPLRGSGWTTLDATPNYLYKPPAAGRIHRHLPKTLIVAVLRDPVKRARSDWNMFHQFEHHPRYKHRYDARSYAQAMTDELRDPSPYGYLARGRYAEQLERYFNLFGRERVLVFAYPKFKKAPEKVVNRILEAAGLEPTMQAEQVGGIRDNLRPYAQTEWPEAVEERLRDYYAPYQAALDELLGHHLDLSEQR